MENISAAVILDVILLAAVISSIVLGASRGLVKTVWKLGTLILTIVLVIALKTPFANMLAETDTADSLYKTISAKVTPTISENLYNGELSYSQQSEVASVLSLPTIVISQVLSDHDAQAAAEGTASAVERAADNISRSITMMILGFVAAVVLFILIKLAFFILYRILSALTKLPVIHGTNKLLGAATGAATALIAVYIITAILSFIAADNPDVYEMVNQTYIVKFFYNYNILLNLFMKI
ncbi:MAG: CvpA family protein [Firmicutes bacterium]|nr:CvpA family protein [Bacillota bacterium]